MPASMTRTPISVSVLTEAALSKRSSLYVWMLDNHDTFAEVVAKAGRPNWKALAEAFGNQGYMDFDDQPPSAEVTLANVVEGQGDDEGSAG